MKTWFWKTLCYLPEVTRVVMVKSLIPSWDKKYKCLVWPTLLVEQYGWQRVTISPLWTMARILRKGATP